MAVTAPVVARARKEMTASPVFGKVSMASQLTDAFARKFYYLASAYAPDWGNPFNQLAVIATYEADDFGAIQFYLRSLALARAFPTSKDNISMLLGKVKKREETAAAGPFVPAVVTEEKEWKTEFVRLAGTVWFPEKE